MTVICKNEKCVHNRINNGMQNILICGKEYQYDLTIGKTGHCQDYKRVKEQTK